MTDLFATQSAATIPLFVITQPNFETWRNTQSKLTLSWVDSSEFTGKLGQILLVPDQQNSLETVLVGWGEESDRSRDRFQMARIAEKLPKGDYEIQADFTLPELEAASLAWLLSQYSFGKYKSKPKARAKLVAAKTLDRKRLETIASAEFLTRDLINTPTSDMGPKQLEAAFCELAAHHDAQVNVIAGQKLLQQNFPMIHAVGRASDQPPRLLDMIWGNPDDPKVTLVGKGVCFDTGGLNIKPGSSMGLMKKDMGGAANVMGLAQMTMAQKLPLRLRVLVPAVENSISAGAFRPQDILTSRKGLTVEINNTDAEGRLVLADALALADEEAPEMIICMATLTGAARVALGPDVPPFFTDDDALSADLAAAANSVGDPLWRLPFWQPYEELIEPGIADLDNAPSGGFGGAITAALFLRRFVEKAEQFVHLDVYGWTPKAKPARPVGGAGQGIRALFALLEERALT